MMRLETLCPDVYQDLTADNFIIVPTTSSKIELKGQNANPGGVWENIWRVGSTYNSAYNTEIGYLASTTGNITGIYDMSGGAHEYMASYRSGTIGSSGFTATSIANYDTKYFDVYNASSSANGYQYRILGDATGEMGPFKQYLDSDNVSRWHNSWYSDNSRFVESSYPWFFRGGYYADGVLAGQFYFAGDTGGVYTHIGSRLVLTVN